MSTAVAGLASKPRACRAKFRDFFPDGFRDPTYLETERAYKWEAHLRWTNTVAPILRRLPRQSRSRADIAREIVRVEAQTNLLFSFEKMALRDAVDRDAGSRAFVGALAHWLYGEGTEAARFSEWCGAVAELPRRQTRVLTWPIATVFGFIGRPRVHMILKPNVTRRAAEAYGYPFSYTSKPNWETYRSLLGFARAVRRDLVDLKPRDMIDIQSFLWVQGSDEYR